MKTLLPLVLLVASLAPAAVIRDSFGFEVNVVRYDPIYETVVYTEPPPWANLPGMQFYFELLMAKAFGDDFYIYNFVLRHVVAQINLDPPQARTWVEFVRVGEWAAPTTDNTPEPHTYALMGVGLAMLGLWRRAGNLTPR